VTVARYEVPGKVSERWAVPAGTIEEKEESRGIIKHMKIKLYYVPIDESNYWMAHTFYSLNVHCIFSTKERVPMLSTEVRERLWPYLGGIAKQNGVKPACIGGVADHVHLLLSLPTTIATAKIIQLIKAGSSAWIHDTFKDLRNFAWQDGYGAFSVSVSHMSGSITCSLRTNIFGPRKSFDRPCRDATSKKRSTRHFVPGYCQIVPDGTARLKSAQPGTRTGLLSDRP
jgi:putative transposase